jgi:hypothetical protein
MLYFRIFLCAIALAVGLGVSSVSGQAPNERVVDVEPLNLVESPQRYWSRAVRFMDVIAPFEGRERKLGERRYIEIETREAGRIYLDAALVESNPLQADRTYLFSGTVISEERSGFLGFGGGTRYYITVRDLELQPLAGDWAGAEAGGIRVRGPMDFIRLALRQAHQNLGQAAAQQEGERLDLFDPEAPAIDAAAAMALTAVKQVEAQTGLSSDRVLSQLVRMILERKYTADAQAEKAAGDEASEEDASQDDASSDDEGEADVEADAEAMDDAAEKDVEPVVAVEPEGQEDGAADAADATMMEQPDEMAAPMESEPTDAADEEPGLAEEAEGVMDNEAPAAVDGMDQEEPVEAPAEEPAEGESVQDLMDEEPNASMEEMETPEAESADSDLSAEASEAIEAPAVGLTSMQVTETTLVPVEDATSPDGPGILYLPETE